MNVDNWTCNEPVFTHVRVSFVMKIAISTFTGKAGIPSVAIGFNRTRVSRNPGFSPKPGNSEKNGKKPGII